MLGLSLAVSLSGCSIFDGWDRTNYPKPSAKACFFNPQIANDIKGGEERWVIKEAVEKGIPPQIAVFTLIASLKELEMRNDAVPLEEIYAQMKPPALSHFLLGCATILAKEGNDLSADRNLLIREGSLLLGEGNVLQEEYVVLQKENKIAQKMQNLTMKQIQTWKTAVNAVTLPQPSQETCSVSYVNSHLQLAKAEEYATGLYLLKPIKNQKLRQYIIWGWQNAAFEKQTTTYSKQVTALSKQVTSDGKQVTAENKQILQSLNHDNPQNSSFMNNINALIRQSLPLTNQFEQETNKFEQKTNQFEQNSQKFEKYNNKFEQLAKVTTPRIVAFNKAVAETKNGNYANLLALYEQLTPQKWRSFMVGCLKIVQATHQPVAIILPSYAKSPFLFTSELKHHVNVQPNSMPGGNLF